MFLGAGILATVFTLTGGGTSEVEIAKASEDEIFGQSLNSSSAENGHIGYRTFSDTDIKYMYGALALVTVCANVIFALLPSREVENCIEGKDQPKTSFRDQMHYIISTFVDFKIILLSTLFMYLGLWTMFWIAVYPTTLIFNNNLASYTYLPVFFGTGVGVGEIVMSLFINAMSKRNKDFGLQPTMYIGSTLSAIVIALITLSTPMHSTISPTNELPLLIEPNIIFCLLVSFGIGLADCCMNNIRTVICALAMPHRRAQTFSVSKFWQSFAGGVMLFVSPYLTMYHYTVILTLSLILSSILFSIVAEKVKRFERKVTMENLAKAKNQMGDLAGTSENRPDKQSGEELSACLKGTHWSRLPVEMQIEIIKQKNLVDGDKLNLLCAYPDLLSVINESYPHDNPNVANGGKGTVAESSSIHINYSLKEKMFCGKEMTGIFNLRQPPRIFGLKHNLVILRELDSESKHTATLLDALESTSTTTRKLCFVIYKADFQLVLAFTKKIK
ncbi:hypothetical protein WR25_09230 [Diploscapter pachys]|uniref:Major facilitator superfamily associated domain-containing protein n=1 Tax=Diploscapter pachys TaxID=2018661 RepID=A0A2A2JVS8_9BILA|nr:hypothetical protein WR25_09230 [Diploscapter pachys]